MPRGGTGPLSADGGVISTLHTRCHFNLAPTSRAQARSIMEMLGYGPNNRLKVTLATRNVQGYRDPAVILISQLKEIYIDADLNPIDTAQWYPTLTRKDFKIAMNVTEIAVDDPDVMF